MYARLNILFIINPISGTVKKSGVEILIKKHLDYLKFTYQIKFTEYPNHAFEIAKNEAPNYQIIVAVGGDGTVHEVGTALIHTNTILGILPMGSGNGLARHLKIPINTKKAILVLNNFYSKKIDTVKLNNFYFLGAAGIGFDAHISALFASSTTRGLITYLKISIKEFFAYEEKNYRLTINGVAFDKKAFLITFANSNQYGNNAFIAPNSKIDDGVFSVVILKKFPLLYALPLAVRLFSKKITSSRFIEEITTTNLSIETASKELHIDGEPIRIEEKIIIELIPLSLNVISNE